MSHWLLAIDSAICETNDKTKIKERKSWTISIKRIIPAWIYSYDLANFPIVFIFAVLHRNIPIGVINALQMTISDFSARFLGRAAKDISLRNWLVDGRNKPNKSFKYSPITWISYWYQKVTWLDWQTFIYHLRFFPPFLKKKFTWYVESP